jgi:hypothetical protein
VTLRISKVLARHVAKNERLSMVPPAVIEEVIDEALDRLANTMPMGTPASEVNAIEFEFCEMCEHAIDPENREGAAHDCEGVWLCSACHADEVSAQGPECPGCGANGTSVLCDPCCKVGRYQPCKECNNGRVIDSTDMAGDPCLRPCPSCAAQRRATSAGHVSGSIQCDTCGAGGPYWIDRETSQRFCLACVKRRDAALMLEPQP